MELTMLSKSQIKLIEKRIALGKIWPWFAWILLLGWGGAWIYSFYRIPIIANPFYVLEKLETNQIEHSTLIVLSGICPLLFNTIGFVFLVLIILFIDRMLTEKKFLEIIDILREPKG
jgi:hypothetical protein